ncbi:MAG: tryptophan-rich sensory protein [Clostridia bacterium]|nr:tryptophan-rich sensory protein [Clostridia bacterium]
MWRTIKPYVISIAIALGVGGLSALLTRNSMQIYADIVQPPLAPPPILFPIVWTVLFILMGVSAAIVYVNRRRDLPAAQSALTFYAMSLIVNFTWSLIFFRFRAFLFAFLWLLFLLYLIIRTILGYRKISRVAAYLQIPYAVWVSFAGYLNLAIWFLNR